MRQLRSRKPVSRSRCGGHNIAGLALADGGLLIDCSQTRGAWVDSKARIAHAQPGCTVGDVDRETQVHGLTAVLGFVSLTGIAGLSLGGGFARLAKVKAAWDPHAMFRANKYVAPAGG